MKAKRNVRVHSKHQYRPALISACDCQFDPLPCQDCYETREVCKQWCGNCGNHTDDGVLINGHYSDCSQDIPSLISNPNGKNVCNVWKPV